MMVSSSLNISETHSWDWCFDNVAHWLQNTFEEVDACPQLIASHRIASCTHHSPTTSKLLNEILHAWRKYKILGVPVFKFERNADDIILTQPFVVNTATGSQL